MVAESSNELNLRATDLMQHACLDRYLRQGGFVRATKTHPVDVNELYAIWRPTKQLLEYARRSEEESDHMTFLIEFAGLFEFWVNRFMQPLIKFPFKHEHPQQTPDQQQLDLEIHDQPPQQQQQEQQEQQQQVPLR